MPVMLTGQRVSFALEFRLDSPDGGVTPGAIAQVQSVVFSVSDPTAIRVDAAADGLSGFVVAVGANDQSEPADVLWDADVDLGPGVRHLTGKNKPDDRFVISQNPATMASVGAMTFGPAEDVPVAAPATP